MDFQVSNEKVVFVHIPKTAGSLSMAVLENALGTRFVYAGHCVCSSRIYSWYDMAWSERLDDVLADKQGALIFTVLRNPYDPLVSMYAYGIPYWPQQFSSPARRTHWPFNSFREFVYALCKWQDYP